MIKYLNNSTGFWVGWNRIFPYSLLKICIDIGSNQKRKDTCNDGKRFPTSIIKINRELKKRFHPTQKPVELFKWLIKSYSNENQLVLDCFAGSGTTAIACIETNRKYICFENNPQYFKIINDRIQSAKSQTQLSNESCPTEDLIGIKRKPCEVSQSLLRKPSLNSDINRNRGIYS